MITLTKDTFDEHLAANSTVLVDFYADWCPPCKTLTPILEELAEELTYISFVKVDTDIDFTLTQRFGVMSLPTMILFNDGEMVDVLVGARSKESLLERLS